MNRIPYRKVTDVAGYSYHADIYCADCGADLPKIDPEGNEKHVLFVSDVDSFADPDGYVACCGTCSTPVTDW